MEDSIELKFKIPRPLHFVAKLKMNQVETKLLEPFAHTSEEGDILKVTISPPHIGQFGLDLYARPKETSENTTLSHALKYLINALKVSNPVEIPKNTTQKSVNWKGKVGPLPLFDELKLKVLSPKDPKISLMDVNTWQVWEIYVPDNIAVSHQVHP